MTSMFKRGQALSLAVLVLAALSLRAQEPSVKLAVQAADGQTVFRIGERIPIKLTFTSANDTQYIIAPWVGGRGGEFDLEDFQVLSSGGWSDPFALYFAQNLIKTGHGWSWPPFLSSNPVQGAVDLNEWIRFDQPGDYTIRVTSRRVCRTDGAGAELLSKEIKLHIAPATPEWQSEKLKSILDRLDRKIPSFEEAAADLKYLGTPEAVEEMTSRLRQMGYYIADESSMGLKGLPDSIRPSCRKKSASRYSTKPVDLMD